eukprot:UN07182
MTQYYHVYQGIDNIHKHFTIYNTIMYEICIATPYKPSYGAIRRCRLLCCFVGIVITIAYKPIMRLIARN